MTGPDASLSLILQVMLIRKAFDLVSPSRSFPSSRSRQVITPGVWEMWLQAGLGLCRAGASGTLGTGEGPLGLSSPGIQCDCQEPGDAEPTVCDRTILTDNPNTLAINNNRVSDLTLIQTSRSRNEPFSTSRRNWKQDSLNTPDSRASPGSTGSDGHLWF